MQNRWTDKISGIKYKTKGNLQVQSSIESIHLPGGGT